MRSNLSNYVEEIVFPLIFLTVVFVTTQININTFSFSLPIQKFSNDVYQITLRSLNKIFIKIAEAHFHSINLIPHSISGLPINLNGSKGLSLNFIYFVNKRGSAVLRCITNVFIFRIYLSTTQH